MLKVINNGKDGVEIISEETGIKYDLLEMIGYKGQATSDIVMVMIATDEEGYVGMLDYCFGATFYADTIDYAMTAIQEYERGERKALTYDNPFCTEFDKYLEEHNLTNILKIYKEQIKENI